MVTVTTRKENFHKIRKIGTRQSVILAQFKIADINEEECLVCQQQFTAQPGEDQLRQEIRKSVNEYTDEQILSSHVYNGNRVWLSSENQFNFKAAYDIAVQTNGANLPVTFKLGTDNEPDYVEFADLNSLAEFYFGCVKHINDCLKRGWDLKNSFNYEDYILPKEQQS